MMILPRKEQMRGVMELWRYKVYTPQNSSRKISLPGGQVELIHAADFGGCLGIGEMRGIWGGKSGIGQHSLDSTAYHPIFTLMLFIGAGK